MNEEKINFKNNYKGLLLDIEGVIYEGNKLIEGSIETINKLLANGFKIKYLTNTTTTSRMLIFEKLLQFKLPLNESNIFSPAIATNIFLKKKNISRISLFTNQFLQEDFTDFVIDDIKPEAIILGDLFKNRYCKRENKLSLDLGPFVAALEYATSKKSVLIGKPEKNFFNLAIEEMKLKNEEVVMIGDDIVADIGGAKNICLSTIQVKTGKFQKKDETNVYLQPDYRINSISELPYILGME